MKLLGKEYVNICYMMAKKSVPFVNYSAIIAGMVSI